ncbi:MAG: Rpn family recombination-promoting nuclease/putative transposase [bacterium]|nr:Rpn family recombination-promoting nuclease/putative transposase [bacterium]
MNFVDIKTDIAFKKVFGNENKKEILISFLNSVLDLEGEHKIASITILNPYQAPKLNKLKETILDLRATDQRGITFIVEMQLEKKPSFAKRVLYYTSKAYVNQLEKGGDYPKLNQVIFIGILNFSMFEGDNYLTRHLILNQETQKQEIKDFEFNFIELTKFNETEEELEILIEKWVYFIKNAGSLKMVPKNAVEKELLEAYEEANKYNWTPEELEVYDYWSIKDQDVKGSIELAKDEGKEEKLIEMILRMYKKGISIEDIADIAGLSVDRAKEILEKAGE